MLFVSSARIAFGSEPQNHQFTFSMPPRAWFDAVIARFPDADSQNRTVLQGCVRAFPQLNAAAGQSVDPVTVIEKLSPGDRETLFQSMTPALEMVSMAIDKLRTSPVNAFLN